MDTNTTDNGTQTPYWQSPHLTFRAAAEVWAAAAGVNGAYYPRIFKHLCDMLTEPKRSVPAVRYGELSLIHDAAHLASRARASIIDNWDGCIGTPQLWRESLAHYYLKWATSVETVLATDDDGVSWRVMIFGEHPVRIQAARTALASIGDLQGKAPAKKRVLTKLKKAAQSFAAVRVGRGYWAYWSHEHQSYWVVTSAALRAYADLMDIEGGHSQWCAYTPAREQRPGWKPGDPFETP